MDADLVVLSPDPNVFRHSNPLAGLANGGAFVVQSDKTADELRAVTGLDFGYKEDAPKKEREHARLLWTRWWSEQQTSTTNANADGRSTRR